MTDKEIFDLQLNMKILMERLRRMRDENDKLKSEINDLKKHIAQSPLPCEHEHNTSFAT